MARKDSTNRNAAERRRIKQRLAEAQNWRCCYCGIRMMGEPLASDSPTFEHVKPWMHGGTHAQDNLVICCRECNESKGRRDNRLKLGWT